MHSSLLVLWCGPGRSCDCSVLLTTLVVWLRTPAGQLFEESFLGFRLGFVFTIIVWILHKLLLNLLLHKVTGAHKQILVLPGGPDGFLLWDHEVHNLRIVLRMGRGILLQMVLSVPIYLEAVVLESVWFEVQFNWKHLSVWQWVPGTQGHLLFVLDLRIFLLDQNKEDSLSSKVPLDLHLAWFFYKKSWW